MMPVHVCMGDQRYAATVCRCTSHASRCSQTPRAQCDVRLGFSLLRGDRGQGIGSHIAHQNIYDCDLPLSSRHHGIYDDARMHAPALSTPPPLDCMPALHDPCACIDVPV